MWRMVWEYRIEVVLMLTALTEDGTEVNATSLWALKAVSVMRSTHYSGSALAVLAITI